MRFICSFLLCMCISVSPTLAEARGVFDVIRTTSQLIQSETRSTAHGRSLESDDAVALHRSEQL